MAKQQTATLHNGPFKTVWTLGPKGTNEVHVDVFFKDRSEPVLQWAYAKLPGNNLSGNAAIWVDQAILQARENILPEDQPYEIQVIPADLTNDEAHDLINWLERKANPTDGLKHLLKILTGQRDKRIAVQAERMS